MVIFASVILKLPYLNNPISDWHSWNQISTMATTARYIAQDGLESVIIPGQSVLTGSVFSCMVSHDHLSDFESAPMSQQWYKTVHITANKMMNAFHHLFLIKFQTAIKIV